MALDLTLLRICILISISTSAIQQGSRDPFDIAFERARDYGVEFDDPASIAEGVRIYEEVAESFPNHPRRYRADLGAVYILAGAMTPESLAEASQILEGLLKSTDVRDPAGKDVILAYADFQVYAGNDRGYEDLERAEALVRSIMDSDRGNDRSLHAYKAATYLAKIMIRQDREKMAVSFVLGKLDEYSRLSRSGFFLEFPKDDTIWGPTLEWGREIEKLATTTAWAIQQSGDMELVELMRTKPNWISEYDLISIVINQVEEKNGLRFDLAKVEAEMFEEVMKEIVQSTAVQPPPNLASELYAPSSPELIRENLAVGSPTESRPSPDLGFSIGLILGGLLLAAIGLLIFKSIRQ